MNQTKSYRRTPPMSQLRRSISGAVLAVIVAATGSAAQDAASDTAVIDTIRTQAQISESDQRRIGEWIDAQIAKVKGAAEDQKRAVSATTRELLRVQFENSANTPAFKEQFASKVAATAVAQLGTIDAVTARMVVKTLLDFNRPESIPAFLAGLKSKDAGVRMVSAAGLASQRAAIAGDKARLDSTAAALKETGMSETDGVVLDRIYLALSVPPAQAGQVFDAFMAIFDKRLEKRRGGAVNVDGAEITAYEFFRTPGVIAALNPSQKEQLVKAIATFLRFDGQRYAVTDLPFNQFDAIQRLLDGGEDILIAAVGSGKGGDVRGVLASGGTPAQIMEQVRLWVGDQSTSQQGALNAAPWNVPVGAP